MGFLDLGVLAKLEAAVFRVVDGKAGDDLAWGEVTYPQKVKAVARLSRR